VSIVFTDHVFIFVHVLYIHAHVSNDGRDNTLQSHNMIEYHFYLSDEHENATLFVQHCFGLIYDSLNNNWVYLNNTRFGQMVVRGSSNQQDIFTS